MFPHLIAKGPHPGLGAHADTYGRLIGGWRGEYRDIQPDGDEVGPMEAHFAWALDGRAVQDVWIAPAPYATADQARLRRRMYGSTLRVFDAKAGAWRAEWFNPVRNARCSLVGRRIGDDIVQTGYWDDRPQRWWFREMTPNSFLWQAHALADDGLAWTLVTEFHLRQIP